jgi:hypothetical protein
MDAAPSQAFGLGFFGEPGFVPEGPWSGPTLGQSNRGTLGVDPSGKRPSLRIEGGCREGRGGFGFGFASSGAGFAWYLALAAVDGSGILVALALVSAENAGL